MGRFLAFIVLLTVLAPSLAASGLTSTTIEGRALNEISRVTLDADGKVLLIWKGGGGRYPLSKVSPAFLKSWGISDSQFEKEFENAMRKGQIRMIDGVIYDLRHPQPKLTHFPRVRLIQRIPDGSALVDPAPDVPSSIAVIHVVNLPDAHSDTERFSLWGMPIGTFKYTSKANTERTVKSYDVGTIPSRSQVPDEIAKGSQSSAPALVRGK